jgi:pyruvate/2-oxoglutarate dehydrogenase complex dihydrolipoamide acyltransferase (E2) component
MGLYFQVMEVALSYDASVLSGEEAALLLQTFKDIAEDPISAL